MITKKQWKEKYAKIIWPQIDIKAYKFSLKNLKKHIFKKDLVSKQNKRTIIIDKTPFQFIKIEEIHEKVLNIIDNYFKDYIYIPKKQRRIYLAAGVAIMTDKTKKIVMKCGDITNKQFFINKNGRGYIDIFYLINLIKTINQDDILKIFMSNDKTTQISSRIKYLKKLQDRFINTNDYNKAVDLMMQIKNLKKRIDNESRIGAFKKVESIIKDFSFNRPITSWYEISYDIIKIASQSTCVPWFSCMNLDTGKKAHFVATGISAGVFIAYHRNKRYEYYRVLFKPYIGYSHNDGIIYHWNPSKIYSANSLQCNRNIITSTSKKFIESVTKYVNNIYKPINTSVYAMVYKVYNDRERRVIKGEHTPGSINQIKKLSKMLDIKDYYNFESYLKSEIKTKEIINFLIKNQIHFNKKYISAIKPTTQEFIDAIRNSFPYISDNKLNAYIEVFEWLFGEEFNYKSIAKLHNNNIWHKKYKEMLYAFFCIDKFNNFKFTNQYEDYINNKLNNIYRILDYYNVTPASLDRLYNYEMNFDIMMTFLHFINFRDFNSAEDFKKLPKNIYNFCKKYVDRYYFENITFDQ